MKSGMKAAVSLSHPGARPAGTIRSIELDGPAGRLEALVNEGAPGAPFAALVCHPNPRYGGTMHHKVVYRAMKVLNAGEWGFGFPVLRFNFRGVGLSQGNHDGKAEAGDVEAALDWLDREYRRPAVVAGFSFGAAMALWACCGLGRIRPNVRALIALGLPTCAGGRNYRYGFLQSATLPKLFVSGDRDPFGPAAQLREVVDAAAAPRQLILIPDSDHFFTGHVELMQNALAGWLKEQLS